MEELHSVFAVGAGGVTKLVPRVPGRIERVSVPKYPYEYLAMDGDPAQMQNIYQKIREFYAEEY